jgi:hypothetical protein
VLLVPRSTIQQDRPERCGSTGILLYSSPLTHRLGFVSSWLSREFSGWQLDNSDNCLPNRAAALMGGPLGNCLENRLASLMDGPRGKLKDCCLIGYMFSKSIGLAEGLEVCSFDGMYEWDAAGKG